MLPLLPHQQTSLPVCQALKCIHKYVLSWSAGAVPAFVGNACQGEQQRGAAADGASQSLGAAGRMVQVQRADLGVP